MKKSTMAVMMAMALGVSGIYVVAQSAGGPGQPQDGPPGGGRGPGPDGRPPRPPLEMVLDADGDGIISAAEIANASAALKKLDKNNDGQLTPEEYRPRRPFPGGPGGPGRPGGPGDGGPDGPGAGHRPPPPGQGGEFGPPPNGRPPQDQ